MDLSRFPRRRYSDAPTPLHHLPNLSKLLDGPEIWIKRDDMLGLAPGGNKTRKLEFLVAQALAEGADTLITCGAPQSNHCRITLAAANREGLKCRLVIEERIPGSYSELASGNHFLFRLMGVEAIEVVAAKTPLLPVMQAQAELLARDGRKAYIIPGGGSNALGGLGYVVCAEELKQQFKEQNLQFDHLLVASGSSGTHGGLVAGFNALSIDLPILGIGVSRDAADQEPIVLAEAQAVLDLLGVQRTVLAQAVRSLGGYWQPGYSRPNAAMVEAVQLLARSEGILIDPVYSGKAMAGLIDQIRRGVFRRGEKVLFLHTGSVPTLHAFEAAFR